MNKGSDFDISEFVLQITSHNIRNLKHDQKPKAMQNQIK